MGIKEYDEGMDMVIKEDVNLELVIKCDFYFLGCFLGKKYN